MYGISLSSMSGIPIYDSNAPGSAVPPLLINSYSTLTIPANWRAVTFLANNFASFPRSIYKDESKAQHPLNTLLSRRPNGYQDAFQFWHSLFLSASHIGNGYARIERDAAGFRPKALHKLLSEDITPFRYIDDKGQVTQCYYEKPTKAIYLGQDIIHLMGSLSYDGQAALAPITLFVNAYQKASLIDRFMTRILMKGTVLRGAVELPGEASQETIEQIINQIRTFFMGADAERDVLVIPGGGKLNNSGLTPMDGQIIEQSSLSTKQIAQIHGIHPYFLFDDKDGKYRNTVEQAGSDVLRFTLRPLIERYESQLTNKLLTDAEQDGGYSVHIDPTALVRGDTLTITSTNTALAAAGIKTPNEVRGDIGLPPSTDPIADKLKVSGDTSPPLPGPSAARDS
jgi:HK97 family phage portal protein